MEKVESVNIKYLVLIIISIIVTGMILRSSFKLFWYVAISHTKYRDAIQK